MRPILVSLLLLACRTAPEAPAVHSTQPVALPANAAPSEAEAQRVLEALSSQAPGLALDDAIRATSTAWNAPASGRTPEWARHDLALLAVLRCSEALLARRVVDDMLRPASGSAAASTRAPQAILALAEVRLAYEENGTPLLPATLELVVLEAGSKAARAAHGIIASRNQGESDDVFSLEAFLAWARKKAPDSAEANGYLYERLAHSLALAQKAVAFQPEQDGRERAGETSPEAWLAGAELLVSSVEVRMWGAITSAELRSAWESFAATSGGRQERRVWDRLRSAYAVDPAEAPARAAEWLAATARVRIPFGDLPALPLLPG